MPVTLPQLPEVRRLSADSFMERMALRNLSKTDF
jgi:hypothetical protein